MKSSLLLNIQIIYYKISDIIKSWYMVLTATQEQKILSNNRRDVCMTQCEALKICPECGCPLIAKTIRKLNECPLNKW